MAQCFSYCFLNGVCVCVLCRTQSMLCVCVLCLHTVCVMCMGALAAHSLCYVRTIFYDKKGAPWHYLSYPGSRMVIECGWGVNL